VEVDDDIGATASDGMQDANEVEESLVLKRSKLIFFIKKKLFCRVIREEEEESTPTTWPY
jgi:hypothetical protein